MEALMDAQGSPPRSPRVAARDRGVSLIEVVITVVLLGTVVVSVLTTMSVTITATALDRDHSNAHAWLQTAADTLYSNNPIGCLEDDGDPLTPAPTPATIEATRLSTIALYQATAQATHNPEGWDPSLIQLIDLEYWHYVRGTDNFVDEGWTYHRCEGTDLQRLTFQVSAPDGRIVEEVEVIVGGE